MWRGGFLLGVMIAAPALADTWYLSPSGNDSPTAGTRDAPFRTAQYAALHSAIPGDTLVLLDGTYAPMVVDCSIGVAAGTAPKPYVVQPEHEGAVRVQGDGLSPVLQVIGCSFWVFKGLDLRSAEASSSSQAHSGVRLTQTTGVAFRRTIFSTSNRQVDGDELLLLDRTVRSVIEDCELYAFHSAAIRVAGGVSDVFRRDYFHSRGWATTGAPTVIELSPCDSCLIENVVSETNGAMVAVIGGTASASVHNRVLGSISLSDQSGVLVTANAGSMNPPDDTVVKDLVTIEPQFVGLGALGASNVSCTQCTSIGGSDGFDVDLYDLPDGGTTRAGRQNFALVNVIADGARFAGISLSVRADPNGTLAFTNSWDNAYEYIPMLDPDSGTLLSENPVLGACKVFVPSSSPMKGAGQDGGDIGANVLFRSVDAGLTPEPLWDVGSGAFPCGPHVAGLNDVPDASCFDVHVRLGINDPMCPLPTMMPGPDGGAPDAGGAPTSAYGLRCASSPGGLAWLWLAAWALRRRRR